MEKVVLDTNILLYFSRRQNAFWKLKAHLHLPEETDYSISAVSLGEIKHLQDSNEWGALRVERFKRILQKLEVIPVTGEVLAKHYSSLKRFSENNHPDLTPKNKQAFNMKQNDLWVGATALLLNAPLITTDKDFLPYHGKLINVLYVSPEIFKS